MLAAFVAGALAGYAIAIPVGAVAVLIVDTGVRRGFRAAAAAGAGTATADFLYATLAMAGGSAVAPLIGPVSVPLRAAAVVVLLLLAARGLLAVARQRRSGTAGDAAMGASDAPGGVARRSAEPWLGSTYVRFVGLTLLNPATVVYFAALVLALPSLSADPLARPAFVVGALLASLSWQLLLAGIAGIAHHRLPARFQVGISVLGSVMIFGFAIALARSLVAP